MAKYKSYLHVERLEKPECEGLLANDEVYVTAKIDGTNSVIWYDQESNKICAGSRKRELSAFQDNASFYAWVNSDQFEARQLRMLAKDHPDLLIYGEWLGLEKFIGSIKTYDKEALGHFYIFDMFCLDDMEYLHEKLWRDIAKTYLIEDYCVELLAVLNHPSYEDVVEVAENNHFLLTHAENKGEGVVCKVPGWKNKYGNTCYGKIVLDEFHQHKKAGKHKPQIARSGVEHDIVEYFVTDSEMAKSKAKVCVELGLDEFDIKSGKCIGMYLNFCWNDLIEETGLILKKYRNPIIDFAVLKAECQNQARKYIGLI